MDLSRLQDKLMAAARSNPPSAAVPFAFEERVLACVAAEPRTDACAQWSRALWWAVAPCAGLMLLLGAWTFLVPGESSPGADLSQQFESTVLVAVDQVQSAEPLW